MLDALRAEAAHLETKADECLRVADSLSPIIDQLRGADVSIANNWRGISADSLRGSITKEIGTVTAARDGLRSAASALRSAAGEVREEIRREEARLAEEARRRSNAQRR